MKAIGEALKEHDHGSIRSEMAALVGSPSDVAPFVNGQAFSISNPTSLLSPEDHDKILGRLHPTGQDTVKMAINAALISQREWQSVGV